MFWSVTFNTWREKLIDGFWKRYRNCLIARTLLLCLLLSQDRFNSKVVCCCFCLRCVPSLGNDWGTKAKQEKDRREWKESRDTLFQSFLEYPPKMLLQRKLRNAQNTSLTLARHAFAKKDFFLCELIILKLFTLILVSRLKECDV